MLKVAVVAAMEREIGGLVKGWASSMREYDGGSYKFFERDGMVVVCGGVGAEAARRAAEAVIGLYRPSLLISAGFAGALDPELSVGQSICPRHVIDAGDGSRTDSGCGEGILISSESVASAEQKARFKAAYGAQAVDMEAAAVARAAQAHGINFLACKAISDGSDSDLPPLTRFIGAGGRFQTFKFVRHVALRPWLWKGVRRLALDSALAAKSLCLSLEQYVHPDPADETSAELLLTRGLK